MSNNILNEELNQMKYLFGYKAGKVISEQAQPTQQNSKNGIINLVLQMMKDKTPYLVSPLIPGKIIAFPNVQFQDGNAQVSYMEIAPSEGVVEGKNVNHKVNNSQGGKINTIEELENQLKNNQVFVGKFDNFPDTPTRPMDTLGIMYNLDGFKNPTAFIEFLQKNFGDKAKQVLMAQLNKRANSSAKEFEPTPEEARTLLQKLNPQPQTPPQTQTTQPK